MREHVHHQVGVRQAVELAVNLVLRGAGVARCTPGAACTSAFGQRPAQALARIEQLPRGLAAARAAAGLLMPDVEHGAVAGSSFSCW